MVFVSCMVSVCALGVVEGCDVMFLFFFFKQKTAYEMRISDWSSDVCSSDLPNDDVMCLFDDDRGDTVRAARMGKCDAASGCGLAGYGQIGIADYGRTAGETDQPGHAKDADARSARLYAGAIDRKSTRLNSSH